MSGSSVEGAEGKPPLRTWEMLGLVKWEELISQRGVGEVTPLDSYFQWAVKVVFQSCGYIQSYDILFQGPVRPCRYRYRPWGQGYAKFFETLFEVLLLLLYNEQECFWNTGMIKQKESVQNKRRGSDSVTRNRYSAKTLFGSPDGTLAKKNDANPYETISELSRAGFFGGWKAELPLEDIKFRCQRLLG